VDGRLVLEVEVEGATVPALEDLEDRVGALDGVLEAAGGRVRVELPCGS
jgi:hypothetical protein